jgi:gliding motility-associated lipoprotein GldH
MNHFVKTSWIIIAACMLTCISVSCNEINLFEKNINIPKMEWKSTDDVIGSFNIKDTISTYNIYVVIRHTDAYVYNNIWLNIGLQPPGDSLQMQKINLMLGSDVSGWEGIGMNDIWEVRKLISGQPKRFLKTGEYKFSIGHIMRDNPLKSIMSIGLHLQKVN